MKFVDQIIKFDFELGWIYVVERLGYDDLLVQWEWELFFSKVISCWTYGLYKKYRSMFDFW